MEYTISQHSSADPWQQWFEEERGSSDDFDIEEDADDVIEDDYSDDTDSY